MAKKGNDLGKIVAFATIAGAFAAGISYFTKYKSFRKKLEENFHDFEDDAGDDISKIDSTMNRSYVSLQASKKELKTAASDMADAAKEAATAAKNLMKNATAIVSDTAKETAFAVAHTAKDMFEPDKEQKHSDKEDSAEDGGLDYAAGAAKTVEIVEEKAEAVENSKTVSDLKETAAEAAKEGLKNLQSALQNTGGIVKEITNQATTIVEEEDKN